MSTIAAHLKISRLPTRKLLKYAAIFKINALESSTYLPNLFSMSAAVVLRIWIFTQLYRASYSALGANKIGGLNLTMVIWCLMLNQSFQTATKPHVSHLVMQEVKSGSLPYSVVRPCSYIISHLFAFQGRCFANLFANLFVGSLAALVLVGPLVFARDALIFGLLLLILGNLLDFFLSLIIGLLALWVEDVSAFVWIYSKGQVVFGGLILPISLFPDYLQRIVELLPFSQMYYSAARVMVNFDPHLFCQYLLTQLLWILFFGVIAHYLFLKGMKHVAVNGG